MALVITLAAPTAFAAGKKRPQSDESSPGILKRAVVLPPISERFIELPAGNDSMVSFGSNIHAALITRMQQTGQFAIVVPDTSDIGPGPMGVEEDQTAGVTGAMRSVEPDRCLVERMPVASSTIRITIDQLAFWTGSHGERMHYGFVRGNENNWNAGRDYQYENEFPLRTDGEPGWFGSAFPDDGDNLTGLDLGHELNFDVLFLGAALRHSSYQASLGLRVEYHNRYAPTVVKVITTKGKGFFFDLSAHYNQNAIDYVAGILVARRAALLTAFTKAISASVEGIGAEVRKLPVMAHFSEMCEGSRLITVGANYGVATGLRFYNRTQWERGIKPSIMTVEKVFQNTAWVKVEGTSGQIGDVIVALAPGAAPPTMALMQTLGLRVPNEIEKLELNVGRVDVPLPTELKKYEEGFWKRLARGLKLLATLPNRIARYYQFDQQYEGADLWSYVPTDEGGTEPVLVRPGDFGKLAEKSWALRSIGIPAAWGICPLGVDCRGSKNVTVAVIDSGVDYNHPELRRNILIDKQRNSAGWDFISGDSRAYDDHGHGTAIASAVTGGGMRISGVAPFVSLLPVKVFSPYGITSSGALYSGVKYALDQGAKIIVLGWGTRHMTQTIEDALALAREKGALVVVAAGDGGADIGSHAYFPAVYSSVMNHVLTVAATGADRALMRDGQIASNFGKGVDIAAPGGKVQLASPREGYKKTSNTGIAAGFVAGAAALVLSQCPRLLAHEVKSIIIEGATTDAALHDQVPGNKFLSVIGALERMSQVCK